MGSDSFWSGSRVYNSLFCLVEVGASFRFSIEIDGHFISDIFGNNVRISFEPFSQVDREVFY